jgi:iduronate 2-sulfatase
MRARAAFLCLGLFLGTGCGESLPAQPHVLFICVDDLLPRLGCYGSADAETPHLDRLATEGALFTRAYAQYAQCGPSRASVLTGMIPERCGVLRNDADYRTTLPDAVVLPQLFKESGWRTISLGKIHHGIGASDDLPAWSEAPWRPLRWQRWYASEAARAAQAAAEALIPEERRFQVRAVIEDHADLPESEFPDGLIADEAIRRITEHSADGERAGEPLFLAVGFLKPHLPFVSPTKYWDLHEGTNRVLQGRAPAGAPEVALHDSGELRAYQDVPDEGDFSPELASRLTRGYRACASFVDAQIGRVLASLEESGLADDTIVVVWGDHGWHFNELGMWAKQTVFEQALRVPLIVRAPGIEAREQSSFVELVDLFPTLAGLAGLAIPEGLDGRDLAGLLLDDEQPAALAPRAQYPRGAVMGRTIRTETHRYTEWRSAEEVVATELYSELPSINEEVNIAAEGNSSGEVFELRKLLMERFGL